MKKYLGIIIAVILLFLVGCSNKVTDKAYYEVAKLERTNYKEVLGSKDKDLVLNEEFKSALLDFSYKSAADLFEERNGMYSPLSLYIALSELVELVGGDTQAEVMNILGINNVDTFRVGNRDLYKKLSYENKISTVRIANSIWLNDSYLYEKAPLEALKDYYYASSYGVDFTKQEDKDVMTKWVNDNTGGKLGENLFDELDSDTIFVLLNTLYFYDEWVKKFDEKQNFKANFGNVGQVEFMSLEQSGTYYIDDEYMASYLSFKNGLKISFAMPLEEVDFLSFINNKDKLKDALTIKNEGQSLVLYQIPKFSYKSSFDLNDYIESLGAKLIFDINNSNFRPLTNVPIYISSVFQKTFIEIDEQGGKAAAVTGIVGDTESVPMYDVFRLDRPFVYAIYSDDIPLFMGVVANPNSAAEEIY